MSKKTVSHIAEALLIVILITILVVSGAKIDKLENDNKRLEESVVELGNRLSEQRFVNEALVNKEVLEYTE